ncbi:MAG: M20/M25/M40 family metallo-hydrolase [Solirubrobacteraceae bacterium]|nr:M20/M25/M40 family metallo-hydrolase [Solirubrobacteraceae bacterium]
MGDLQASATSLLQQLIRFNTVNPPGNERVAQEFLAGLLREAGFEITLVGAEEERPNLVARLKGAADGPVLTLLSHVDTVLASPADWTHDPWSGDVADGYLWGRGALDMKSQTACEVAAALDLAQSGWRPATGDLMVIVLADEETGGSLGAQWICEHHPELVKCDYVLNEGAGAHIPFDGGRRYGVCVAEKGVFRFRIRTEGVAGHASYPKMGDNALLKMAPILEKLAAQQPDFDLTAAPQALLEGLGFDVNGAGAAAAFAQLQAKDPRLAKLVEPMLGVTFAPTKIRASEKINVIPAMAELSVDCRVPPGLGRDTAEKRIRDILGDEGFTVEFAEQVQGNASPADSPLRDALERWVGENDPGASTVPTILPGFTDSRTWRSTFGDDVVAYGFFPQRHMSLHDIAPLIHGADERIDVRDLGFAASCFRDVALDLLGTAS